MTNRELNNLAEDVRREGYEPESSMKDLVFDPVTGEFRQVEHGAEVGDGEVVTEMTNKGFAVDSTEIIYIKEEDVKNFAESSKKLLIGYGHMWPKENVIHIGMSSNDEIKTGKSIACVFCRTKDELDSISKECSYAIICNNESTAIYKIENHESGKRLIGPLKYEYIPSIENLYSRSKGLLEVGTLKEKRVMIIGLGSFGSQIAIELAKAGVGKFDLIDFDRVELHNLSRHTATVDDLGRLKTDVIEDAIQGKNPYAIVDKFTIDINKDLSLLYERMALTDLVICATDNNTSRFNISKALVDMNKVGIFGRAITRAEGGDVFRYRPGGPCYCCLIGSGNLQQDEITDVASARRDGRIAAYVSPEDAEAMVQVGLSSDIAPICNMMVKLSLVELSKGTESGISCLENELVYDYYMWANRRERHYHNWKSMPNAGSLPTIMRWYGARIQKENNCPICSENITLDVCDEIETTNLEGIEFDLN